LEKFVFKNKITRFLLLSIGPSRTLVTSIHSLYGKIFAPIGKIYTVEIEGVKVDFLIDSSGEFLMLKDFIGEENILKTFLSMVEKKSKVIYDLGAHVGLYTLLAAKVGGDKTIISFEPEPKSYEKLNKNIELNKLRNVKTFNIALSDYNGKTTLNINKMGLASGGHNIAPTGEKKGWRRKSIEVRRLEDLIAEEGLPKPDLIKIDIEGAELNAIKGMEKLLKSEDAPYLIMEVHKDKLRNFGHSDEDLLRLLKKYGLKIDFLEALRLAEHSYFIQVSRK
jgi:FkbM family methyltransferase